MSKPKGKRIQRDQIELIKSTLEPWGFKCDVDFSKRGAYQQVHLTPPNNGPAVTITIKSSPRTGENCMDFLRQRCQRIIRDLCNPLAVK